MRVLDYLRTGGKLCKANAKMCSLGYWGIVKGIKIEQELSMPHTLFQINPVHSTKQISKLKPTLVSYVIHLFT